MSKSDVKYLLLVAAIALGVRVLVIMHTEVLVLGWRPVELVSIAQNYVHNGMNFLFPQILWGGSGPGYVEMEFPLVPYLTATLYRLFGLHDSVTLVVPILSGLGVAIVSYATAKYLYGPTVGLVAGVFAALSPTMVWLTTSLWPDPPMVLAGALALFFLLRWSEEGRRGDYILGAFAASLAILLKLTALYLGIPILFLCMRKYRAVWWKTPRVWMLAVMILLPPALWYWHAHSLFLEYGNSFGILSSGYLKFGTADLLLDPAFYGRTLYRAAFYHVGPVAFLALLYGIFLRQEKKAGYLLHVWIGAVTLSLLVAARGVEMGHYQYVLPLVPAAAPLAALGAVRLVINIREKLLNGPVRRLLAPGAWTVFSVSALAAMMFFHSHAVYAETAWQNDRKTGLAARTVIPDGSLIVVVDNQEDDVTPERSMTPPNVFYFSAKRGWYQSMAWLSPEKLEQLRTGGARYLVVTGNGLAAFRSSFRSFEHYLSNRFLTLLDNSDGMIFDLAVTR